MHDLLTLDAGIALAAASLRLATPLVLAALGGLLAERAGIVDLGLEGKMLIATFAAAAVAAVTGDPWLGLLAAILAAQLWALAHGLASITVGGNQVVSGIALNILAVGVTGTLSVAWFDLGGRTPTLARDARLPVAPWPDPDAGGLAALIGGHSLLVYVALAAVPLIAWGLGRTRPGLRLRAVGENPDAVDAAGVSVVRVRYLALLLGGAMCGLAGAHLSIGQGAGFLRLMTAGSGYLAVAAVIFGRWKPGLTLVGCLVFAVADALQLRLQGTIPVPAPLIQALPYLVTVMVLAGLGGRIGQPSALGQAWRRGG